MLIVAQNADDADRSAISKRIRTEVQDVFDSNPDFLQLLSIENIRDLLQKLAGISVDHAHWDYLDSQIASDKIRRTQR